MTSCEVQGCENSHAKLSNWCRLWHEGGRPPEGQSTTGDRGNKQERADGPLERKDTPAHGTNWTP